MEIKKAAVLGAGVMGMGIAAHLANAGIPVLLLDIVPKEADDRNVVAKGALAKAMKTNPAPFMHKRNAKLVTVGNLEDDLEKLKDVDWIIEVIIENLAIKQGLYEKLEAHRADHTIISSNTSTIPLHLLTEGRSDSFKDHFCVTHFFNPPRYMRLLEIVRGAETTDEVIEAVSTVCDKKLGKGIVTCNDTPGFIANRIGTYWIQTAMNEAMSRGLTVEEADAVMGRPIGIPKTGVFGLVDLVGIDLIPYIGHSLCDTLPADDAYVKAFSVPDIIQKMIDDGYTGRKGKGGFYMLRKDGIKKIKQAKDLKTGDYYDAKRPHVGAAHAGKKGLKAVFEHDSEAGRYALAVMVKVFHYAASLVPEISDTLKGVDDAMKLGYNWKKGPFELMDDLGLDYVAAAFEKENLDIPPLLAAAKGKSFYKLEDGKSYFLNTNGDYTEITHPNGVILLADIKRTAEPVYKTASANVWDIGDGILCVEFTSKMNAIDEHIFKAYEKVIKLIGDGSGDYKALVIYNEGTNFSVGANLGLALFALNIALFPQIEQMVEGGQDMYKKLKYAPFPVVSAPSGMALGGGCEILLHSDAVQAHAETYTGLVEVGVGLIPGWGGSKEMVIRHTLNKKRAGGPMPALTRAFEQISLAKVAKSAEEARSMLILRPTDGVTMNRDRLLADAKAKAIELAKDYTAPEPVEVYLPGFSAKAIYDLTVEGFANAGKATLHDVTVSAAVSTILTGGDTDITKPVTEDKLLELERAQFMALAKSEETISRIEHMLETGKPLRN